jgi:hypothetical protein
MVEGKVEAIYKVIASVRSCAETLLFAEKVE